MVSKELLEILICPSCHGELEYDATIDALTCRGPHCPICGMPAGAEGRCSNGDCSWKGEVPVGLRYRVEENIPVMLIDEAERIQM
ncbi:MAG TPA: hypothetical protein PLN61_10855 [bacterium]|nr:hypothetical protein [bacterium]HQI49148.1 hypothetical protein [bacterium]HQJ66070.1 hypothetical protein [bacterium]